MLRTAHGFASAALIFGIAVTPPAAHSQTPGATAHGSGDLSASVKATWTAEGPPNGPWTLSLLVLWRGSPGWWLDPGAAASMASDHPRGQPLSVMHSVALNDRTWEMRLDPRTRTFQLQKQRVDIGNTNIVFIDGIDTAEGPRIVGGLALDLQFTDTPVSPFFIKQSPELFAFLQCDKPLPEPERQPMVERLCAEMRP
jgi:hypothetical protein